MERRVPARPIPPQALARGPTEHTCEEKVTDRAAPAEHRQHASLCLEPPLIDLTPVHIPVVPVLVRTCQDLLLSASHCVA